MFLLFAELESRRPLWTFVFSHEHMCMVFLCFSLGGRKVKVTRGRDEDGKRNGGSEMTFVLGLSSRTSFEILTKRTCKQMLNAIIITHDDLVWDNNLEPRHLSQFLQQELAAASMGIVEQQK